ncbi:polysaccharide deacetylase family protein [Streptomyces sp. NPDC050738]|uniref:polysaccharide deacetylase family protein n=1 Tax=Streptomyces sp. NPDC050738 TaxID=3154744 RepID=UPI0034178C5F
MRKTVRMALFLLVTAVLAAGCDAAAPAAGGAPPDPAQLVRRVPTHDRVVFLTIDDGTAQDPEFVRLMRELRTPFTMFLTDSMAGSHYRYFDPLHALGNKVQNHTVTHARLTKLSYEGQRAEICGQQGILEQEFGERPTLLRPPGGRYDATTLRAAADCGLPTVVLWSASMQPKGLRYGSADHRLHPGDIILFHFFTPYELHGTTLSAATRTLMRTIAEQGLSVARLEDYLPS